MNIQAPKGTKDMLPKDSYRWHYVEKRLRKAAEMAGYREIRTPVFEHTELFLRGVGDTTDIVQKEMYTFLDKGERSITLKPEGTAGAVRAFIEGRLYAEALPCKMYYLNAPIFRYENPQSGRLREHHQFGMECFGAKEPTAEAELIATLLGALAEIGLDDLMVRINSIGCPACRPAYHDALRAFLGEHISELCPTCQERFDRNPLRVLDCKEEKCQRAVEGAPNMIDMLCRECSEHFDGLQHLLSAQGITFKVDPRIVRGLDYYTRTVFEITMQGAREGLALCGGGRYDGLVGQIGGPETPGVGFGIGTERILMELDYRGIEIPEPVLCDVFVMHVDKESVTDTFNLAVRLRTLGLRAECDHVGRSLKAQFRFADKIGARWALICGGDEKARGVAKLRRMSDGAEHEIPWNNITAELPVLIREAEQ